MQITFYGHNSFLFKSDINILVDPFISSNPKAQHILMENIKVDYVLITHGHADHLADLDKIMIHNDAKIITMVEVASWLAKNGHNRSHSLNFGGIYEFSKKTSVKYVQAVHSSSMPDGSYGGHPGSFILKTDDKTIFIEEALFRLVEIYYRIGLVDEAKAAASMLGYNYNSSEWYERSYKILNKNYQPAIIKKENKEGSLVTRTLKRILFIDEKSGKN